MVHTFEVDSALGPVKATWHRDGRMIVVRYGSYEGKAQASEHDASNLFVARDIVREWIVKDVRDE
jgi:hypothetical protein